MIDTTFPLCELHRHLDGAIRVETIVDLAREHGIALPADTVEGMKPYVHVDENEPGLMAFIARFSGVPPGRGAATAAAATRAPPPSVGGMDTRTGLLPPGSGLSAASGTTR